MPNPPAKTQEEKAREKEEKRKERVLRISMQIRDSKIVLAQLEKQLEEELAKAV